MFGLVAANLEELTQAEKDRYGAVYCGICREIRLRASSLSRLALRYDMAFLALLHMSLYEPEEDHGSGACGLHPFRPRAWVDCEPVRYAADMNLILAYYSARDHQQDDGSLSAGAMARILTKGVQQAEEAYPRQTQAIRQALETLSRLEAENCSNPDLPAGCFGQLMAELLVFQEDRWAPTLRQMGMALGRFIYLADADIDYRADQKKGSYNPFLAMGGGEDRGAWERYLVLAMARCADEYERLPLVQDKGILDNILYSGVWAEFHRRRKDKAGGEAHG